MRLLPLLAAVSLSACLCKSRDEKLKGAEDDANLIAAMKARAVKGIGEAMKKEGTEAAKSVAEGGGDVIKGLGQGASKSLNELKITTHSELTAKGVTSSRATLDDASSEGHKVSVYVAFEKGYVGQLELRVFDLEQREVGRAKAKVDEAESNAKYIDFSFDPHTPLRTADHLELR